MMSLLIGLPLKSADLEFIVREEGTSTPLNQSTVIVEGLTTDYYGERGTGETNSVTFEDMPDNEIYDYTVFHNGHHPFEDGTVYTDSDKALTTDLEPYEEWEWPDYYTSGLEGLALTFSSQDEDVYYDAGDEFNYLIMVQSISGDPVNLSNSDIDAGVYDINNNPVMVGDANWGSPNDDLTYEITFNPYVGWLGYDVQGNNVEACIGDASDVVFNGENYELGPGEVVCQNVVTQDNVVPNGINGTFHVNISIGDIDFTSRNFYVGPVSVKPKQNDLEKEVRNYPNPTNNWFKLENVDQKDVKIYDLRGREVQYKQSGDNFQINSSGIYNVVIGDKTLTQVIIK